MAEGLHLDMDDLKTWVQDVSAEISQVKTERINLDYFYSATCPEEVFRKICRNYERHVLLYGRSVPCAA